MNNKIKLNDSIIPAIPFIWYREEELICPIDHIGTLSIEQVKTLYNYDIPTNPYIIVQRHVKDNANLYICLHSLLFYELHKLTNLDNQDIILTIQEIPDHYCINIQFQVKLIPLNTSEIKEVPGGLRINEFTSGSVFIHGGAFSPPGCLHFKVNEDKETNINEFICFIKCESLNIKTCCLFILFNDLNGTNIDNKVSEYILNL